MKKFYILFAAACVSASAGASEREMAACPQGMPILEKVERKAAPLSFKARTAKENGVMSFQSRNLKTRAEGEGETSVSGLYFRPYDNLMVFSYPKEGDSGYNYGFASPYGKIAFFNYSIGAQDMQWSYSNIDDYSIVDNSIVWNVKTSSEEDLIFDSQVGMFKAPVLTGKVNGEDSEYSYMPEEYFVGGNPEFYLGEEGSNLGLSFYQNTWMADSQGYQGVFIPTYSYFPGAPGNLASHYEPSGACNWWYDRLARYFEGKELTDLQIENFTIITPKPASAYFMTTGWLWASVSASEPTQLTSYIYPLTEDGKISDTPIALGYASIPEGNSNNIVFNYYALNEEGDEIEEKIIIDDEVVFTIEGFNGNPAIESVIVQCGFYPFSAEMYQQSPYSDFLKQPDLYAELSLKADGQSAGGILADTGMYYFGPEGDDDTLSLYAYSQFATDACYPWIKCVNGEESVTLPLAGGETDVVINAYFDNINAFIERGECEVSSSEWIQVVFGESDPQSGDTTMTISVESSETNRTGFVEVSGFGVSCYLKIIQGEDNAVNVVVSEKNAEYFDLQGRRVANPEKGLYIKKTANKTEKVIL